MKLSSRRLGKLKPKGNTKRWVSTPDLQGVFPSPRRNRSWSKEEKGIRSPQSDSSKEHAPKPRKKTWRCSNLYLIIFGSLFSLILAVLTILWFTSALSIRSTIPRLEVLFPMTKESSRLTNDQKGAQAVTVQSNFTKLMSIYFDDQESGLFLANLEPGEALEISGTTGQCIYATDPNGWEKEAYMCLNPDTSLYLLSPRKMRTHGQKNHGASSGSVASGGMRVVNSLNHAPGSRSSSSESERGDRNGGGDALRYYEDGGGAEPKSRAKQQQQQRRGKKANDNDDMTESVLLSENRPVKSDVRGNLAPPSVVTQEAVADWLKDRWQAAMDMSGTPIPGPHWLEVDLGRVCEISAALLDWEDAYSSNWVIQGRLYSSNNWATFLTSKETRIRPTNQEYHILHEVRVKGDAESGDDSVFEGSHISQSCAFSAPFRYVRLLIYSPSTKWGSSIWRFQVWGREKRMETSTARKMTAAASVGTATATTATAAPTEARVSTDPIVSNSALSTAPIAASKKPPTHQPTALPTLSPTTAQVGNVETTAPADTAGDVTSTTTQSISKEVVDEVGIDGLENDIDLANPDLTGPATTSAPAAPLQSPIGEEDELFSIVDGTLLALYNPTLQRFIQMADDGSVSLSDEIVPLESLESWRTWERFEVVDVGGGDIGLYSPQQRRFLRVSNEGYVDGFGTPNMGRDDLPSNYLLERFRLVDAGNGMIAVHNSAFNAFIRTVGDSVDVGGGDMDEDKLPPESEWMGERFIPLILN